MSKLGDTIKIGICLTCGRQGHILIETKRCVDYASDKRVAYCERVQHKQSERKKK